MFGRETMVTSNVLQRTFRLRYGNKSATCFTLDIDGRHYIVTARHCVESMSDSDRIQLFNKGQWRALDVKLVGHGSGDVDVSVLAPDQKISPIHPLPATSAKLVLGQDAYFLGFPFGIMSDSKDLNGEFPLPLVKKGVVSAINFGPKAAMLLDGLNNQGFSGGPVVFREACEPGTYKGLYAVFAVVSGYRFNRIPVQESGVDTPSLTVNENTGIVVAYSVTHVRKLIEANPIGFALPE